MCKDCTCVVKDGNRLICMCEQSENQYRYVHKHDVCDEYKPNENLNEK